MSIFSILRLAMLPKEKISKALPLEGLIYEIGCGKGMLSAFIVSGFFHRRVIGIDADKQKLNFAEKNYANQHVQFVQADALAYNFQKCTGVLFSDFLHHLSFLKQEIILKKIARKIAKNGVLVIKEIDSDDGFLTICSRIWDFIFYPQDVIYYRSRKKWSELLENLGFEVQRTREVPWFPGSTHLYICRKK